MRARGTWTVVSILLAGALDVACMARSRGITWVADHEPPASEAAAEALEPSEAPMPRILFVTQSVGYTHAVVKRPAPDELSLAEKALVAAVEEHWDVDTTQDCATFDWSTLDRYDAVVFYTTGELPMPPEGRAALLRYVLGGGGFVGIHPATDTCYEWPEYQRLVGGAFDGHPWHQKVRVKVENRLHPSTRHLGESFEITDEIYQFKQWNRKDVQVLLSIDADSIDVTKKGVNREDKDFAVAWCRPLHLGRVFYTSLGHRAAVWQDERYLEHLRGGIAWTFRRGRPHPTRVDDGHALLLGADGAEGWRMAGPGRFVESEPGVWTAEGGMGLWWYEPESYRNFSLKLEFRQAKLTSNSGVFVRFPRGNGDPWLAVREGYEIQIHGDKPSKQSTGAVYSFQAPTRTPIKPAGEWNEMQIICVEQRYTIVLNGQTINEFEGERSLVGHVGIQNHGHANDAVSYRNIRIQRGMPTYWLLRGPWPGSPGR